MDLDVNCSSLVLSRRDARSTCMCLACALHMAEALCPHELGEVMPRNECV